ncbi:hypothetical protein NC993_06830 [Leptolyngbya sp. NM1-A1]|uniref:hypothetical protein n=1 Tax=unclassified Leptolyngbya TaxID=2650499 RepID=UPI0019C62C06|nr:hypothetical protein [Phormidium sp. FACHB-77]
MLSKSFRLLRLKLSEALWRWSFKVKPKERYKLVRFSHQVVSGIDSDGNVETIEAEGFRRVG